MPSKTQLLVRRKAFKTLQDNNLYMLTPEELFNMTERALELSSPLVKKERNLEIMKLRYGYYNDKFYTYVELGRRFNICDQAVRQTIHRTMRKINKHLELKR